MFVPLERGFGVLDSYAGSGIGVGMAAVNLVLARVFEADESLTIEGAARRCGVGVEAMRSLVRGYAARVDLVTLARVCDGLKLRVDQVLELDQAAKTP